MLIENLPVRSTRGSVRASFSKQISRSSGSSDREQIAFAVIPPSVPSLSRAQTTATPVGNRAKACLRPSGLVGSSVLIAWIIALVRPTVGRDQLAVMLEVLI
ncbi:unannotated protein [freshwater metagenome]|uniref:Unannotated protein n=1 Tax=freshwater metagenome TaxID=449393 RepID=A0A6J7ETF6_9ZZZZ